jgi:hypothetical protein
MSTGKATKSTKVVVVATKPRKTPAPPENGAPTPAELLAKKKAEEKKAVEAFLKNGNKAITTKKEAVMSAKKEETVVKAVAKKNEKKATNKKEVAPMKKAVKKTVAKATNKKEVVMKGKGKGNKKVEVEKKNHNFVRNEVTVREALAKYNSKLELEPKTDKVYLVRKEGFVVLKRKRTTDEHNLTVFVRKNAGKNAKALDDFVLKATPKDKALVEKIRAQYKGKELVVEILSDRPYIYLAKDVHVCVRYIRRADVE